MIGPGRSSRGGSLVRSRTVDSRPTAVGPLSMIRSIRPSRSARTCSARVGESRFDRLALGAAIGWPRPFDEAAGDLPGGTPHADRRLAGRHQVGDDRGPVQDERERTRPEPSGQGFRVVGPFGDAFPGLVDTRHVDDQRIDRRPSLGREDPRDGRGIGGDGPQAVDGLGREGDQAPAAAGSRPPRRARTGRGRSGSTTRTRVDGRCDTDRSARRRGRYAADQEGFFRSAGWASLLGEPGLVGRAERLVVLRPSPIEAAERPRRVAGQGVGGQERQGDGRIGVAGHRVGQACRGRPCPRSSPRWRSRRRGRRCRAGRR